MTNTHDKPKVIVVVGPTASGKTSLSIDIAKRYSGEIVSADSRQIYRGLDIGTGKVTAKEMDDVPHHLLDIADPTETYTAADFVQDGREAIQNILTRENLPIIAGGTFFYIDALLGRVSTPAVPPDEDLRERLASEDTDTLYKKLLALDPRRAGTIDAHNRHRLIRAIEIATALGAIPEPEAQERYDILTIGIDIPKVQLHENIHTRLLARIDEGMITEVENCIANGISYERLESLGLEYRYVARFLKKELTKADMYMQLETAIRHFAKRQMTWLKRDPSIKWFTSSEQSSVFETIDSFLEDKNQPNHRTVK